MLTIVVIYSIDQSEFRKTINEHAFSFVRYAAGARYYYLNLTCLDKVPTLLNKVQVDGVIFHYSFLALRYAQEEWKRFIKRNAGVLRGIGGIKVAIPQDEYNHTDDLRRFAEMVGLHAIFTCAEPRDYATLYPHLVARLDIFSVFTGYVDERAARRIGQRPKNIRYDIGYRARRLPFWLGRHAQTKSLIVDRTLSSLERAGLACNVGHTEDAATTFLGDSWTDFLLSCRTALGCLGGSGLMDADGSIRERVQRYVEEHPSASFDEAEAACFRGLDGNISLFALSPRHFECAMTRTCQVLLEGDYKGVFIPGRHFIELKEDYSNLDDVIEKIKDTKYCEEIASRCYHDVVESGVHTYRVFANRIIGYIASRHASKESAKCSPLLSRFMLFTISRLLGPAPLRSRFQRMAQGAREHGGWWLARRVLRLLLKPVLPQLREFLERRRAAH